MLVSADLAGSGWFPMPFSGGRELREAVVVANSPECNWNGRVSKIRLKNVLPLRRASVGSNLQTLLSGYLAIVLFVQRSLYRYCILDLI